MSQQRKVRRVRRRSETSSSSSESPRAPRSTYSSRRRVVASEEELRETYAYVLKDLRQIFMIAAAMFLLLIVLGLVL